MRRIALVLPFLLCACSAYRSEGRKFLESNLTTIGVHVSAYVETCGFETAAATDTAGTSAWEWYKQTDTALVYLSQMDFGLRVVSLIEPTYHCDYRLPNAQIREEQTDAAIADTNGRLETTLKPSGEDEVSF